MGMLGGFLIPHLNFNTLGEPKTGDVNTNGPIQPRL
jgi:hypothetical protein